MDGAGNRSDGWLSYGPIVIDTPPTLGIITVNALVAATHVLIPIQSSYFALEGTDDLLETVDRIAAELSQPMPILLEVNVSGEAAKHGFKRAIVPRGNLPRQPIEGMKVEPVTTLAQALELLD